MCETINILQVVVVSIMIFSCGALTFVAPVPGPHAEPMTSNVLDSSSVPPAQTSQGCELQ